MTIIVIKIWNKNNNQCSHNIVKIQPYNVSFHKRQNSWGKKKSRNVISTFAILLNLYIMKEYISKYM